MIDFLPSIFHEIVSFLRPINDNDAMNGRTIWEMSLASHLRMFRARGKSLEKSVEQHNSAECNSFCCVLHGNGRSQKSTLLLLVGNRACYLWTVKTKQYFSNVNLF